jgi:hypothetical protein
MTSVDADLRSGRRLETGRRSESIIYIVHIVYSCVYVFSVPISYGDENKRYIYMIPLTHIYMTD